jgi:hypothetical protein
VSPRTPSRDPDPMPDRLRKPGEIETEDTIALIGFVVPTEVPPEEPESEQQPVLRISPDTEGQRWLEIPFDDVIDRQQIDPGNALTRSVVWARRTAMMQPILDEQQGSAVEEALTGVPVSTWNLIPETRLVAAYLLSLIPYDEGGALS